MEKIKIKDIMTIVTAPRDIDLVVVKVITDTPGLVGYGCATFTWRWKAVVTAIDEYLRPLLIGRDVDDIEDIWQTMKGSSYWRSGPVLNNAISGVDMALWDIKGKRAGLPLYSLLGGKSREGIALYRHADGSSIEEVEDKIRGYMEEGYTHIRCHMGTYGGNFDGKRYEIHKPMNAPSGAYYDPKTYMRSVINLFERIRTDIGWDIDIMHDVHERLSLSETLQFAKDLEPYKLFFLEDALPPAQVDFFKELREHTVVPFAMGELFTTENQFMDIIENRWIDFIRCHISMLGGITPARKLAEYAGFYGVRTAWHGPSDLSPIGMAAQMHLDLNVHNFGIQEFMGFSDEEMEVFPHCPTVKDGYAYLEDIPGIGTTIDEEKAKLYPPVEMDHSWMLSRITDGTAVRP